MKVGVEKYNLDRKAASKLLKISIRTIDRYVKAKKLSSKVVNGRIWLDRKEVERYRLLRSRQAKVDNDDMSTSKMSIDKGVVEVTTLSTSKRRKRSSENTVYENLYNKLKEETNEKQERLEIANYRVGQLETQIKNSIPMLEYHREKFEKNKQAEELQIRFTEQNAIIKRISAKLNYEKISKRLFLVILLIILALQPLWLLLIYK